MPEPSNEISMSEVRKHNTESSAWIVVDNHVYDVTKYIDEHPGGADVLLEAAGSDATREFKDVGHSDDAREIMQKYKMGKVSQSHDRHDQCDSCVWYTEVDAESSHRFCEDVNDPVDNTSMYAKIAIGVLAAGLIAGFIAKRAMA